MRDSQGGTGEVAGVAQDERARAADRTRASQQAQHPGARTGQVGIDDDTARRMQRQAVGRAVGQRRGHGDVAGLAAAVSGVNPDIAGVQGCMQGADVDERRIGVGRVGACGAAACTARYRDVVGVEQPFTGLAFGCGGRDLNAIDLQVIP